MRFAFAGIDFMGDALDVLIAAGWRPVKVFTRPCDGIYDVNDAVVARARQAKVPIQLSRLAPEDVRALAEAGCEALVVAGYPWLVKGWAGHLPYALNIHPSPLPDGRGPYPLFRAILGERTTWGVTAHRLDESFDTGPILAQELFPTAPDETHETLLAKCQLASRRLAALLATDLPRLWAEARPQGAGSYWPRTTDRDRTIDWSRGVADILRKVRAFGAVETIARLGDAEVFVAAASGWTEAHRFRPGTVVHRYRRHVVMAAQDGFVQVTRWSPVPLARRNTLLP